MLALQYGNKDIFRSDRAVEFRNYSKDCLSPGSGSQILSFRVRFAKP